MGVVGAALVLLVLAVGPVLWVVMETIRTRRSNRRVVRAPGSKSGLVLGHVDGFTLEHAEFTEKIPYGTQALLYINLELGKLLLKEKHVTVVEARWPVQGSPLKKGELAGLLALTHSQHTSRVITDATPHDLWIQYVKFLCVSPAAQGRGLSRELLAYGLDVTKQIRKDPGLTWSLIEDTNYASLGASTTVDAMLACKLNCTGISWRKPPKSPHVSLLSASERSAMVTRLENLYSEHFCVEPEETLDMNSYYVFKREGRITAGVQANMFPLQVLHCWTLPLVWILSKLPFLQPVVKAGMKSRMFTLGNVWCEPGFEDDVLRTVLHIQAVNDYSGALMHWDRRSEFFRRVVGYWESSMNKQGLFGRLLGYSIPTISVIIKPLNMDDKVIQDVIKKPWLGFWRGL
ncbi:hypothetical protein Pelo_9373 [Pelomyxa schiedti]|nr:hypothetical protein Pelo_9373 [Pelomyxa schiedti]